MRTAVLWIGLGCGRFGFDPSEVERVPVPSARYLFDDDPTDGVADVNGEHPGACLACPTLASAVDGGGYRFTGTEVITVDATGALDTFDAVSVAAWIRPEEQLPTGRRCIASKPFGSGIDNTWQICIESSRLFACAGDPGSCASSRSNLLEVATWLHVTYVHDGSMMRVWAGGELVIERPNALEIDDSAIVIGGDHDNGEFVNQITGMIDDLRIWDVALTEDDVAELVAPL